MGSVIRLNDEALIELFYPKASHYWYVYSMLVSSISADRMSLFPFLTISLIFVRKPCDYCNFKTILNLNIIMSVTSKVDTNDYFHDNCSNSHVFIG